MNITSGQDTKVNYAVVFLFSSFALVCFITNIVYILVCFKTLRSNLYHLLILSLYFSDTMLSISAFVIGIAPLFPALRQNLLACIFQFFFLFSGLFLTYCIHFMLCIQRFYALLTNNFGSHQRKIENCRYLIVGCVMIFIFCYETVLFTFIPKSDKFNHCTAPNMFHKHTSIFMGFNIIPITIIMSLLPLIYAFSSRIIWRKFINGRVNPLAADPELMRTEKRNSKQKEDSFITTSLQETSQLELNNTTRLTECFTVDTHLIARVHKTTDMQGLERGCSVSGISVDLDLNVPTMEFRHNDLILDDNALPGKSSPTIIVQSQNWVEDDEYDSSSSSCSYGKRIKTQNKKKTCNTTSQRKAQISTWEIRAFVTCLILACQTVILTGPIIGGFFNDIVSSQSLSLQTKFILSIPYFLNILSNPIMYTWRIKEIRQAFCNLCRKPTYT